MWLYFLILEEICLQWQKGRNGWCVFFLHQPNLLSSILIFHIITLSCKTFIILFLTPHFIYFVFIKIYRYSYRRNTFLLLGLSVCLILSFGLLQYNWILPRFYESFGSNYINYSQYFTWFWCYLKILIIHQQVW